MTFEEFEIRVLNVPLSDRIVQENALIAESAFYLVLLILCNHVGIKV